MPEELAARNQQWNWALLYYAGTVRLHMPPERFWRTSMRTLLALIEAHAIMSGTKKEKPKLGYIDQIM